MNETTSETDRFRSAFESLNGRAPTIEEVKDAQRFLTVIEKTGLDPFLLSYIADVKNREQRDRLPAEISKVVAGGLNEIRKAIPTGGDLADRLQEVETFRTTMDRAEKTMVKTTSFLATRVFPLLGITAIVLSIILGAFAVFTWRTGYAAGYANRSNDQACGMLGNVYQQANAAKDGRAKKYVGDAYTARCR